MTDRSRAWEATTFGAVLTERHERRGEHAELPVLSVTKTRGPMLASERFGKALHGRDLAKYRVARRGTIVADPMLLWDGAIGRQNVVDAGLVSPDYRVYELAARVSPDFMGYVVRSAGMLRHYQGGARGTNVRRNRIARGDFLRIPLRLPPLPEQRRIAAILSAADAVIEKTQSVIESLQTLKKAMMDELLTRGLPGRHVRFKQTEIGELPEEWEVASLELVLERIDGGWSPQCLSGPPPEGQWGVLKVSAVTSGAFRCEESKALPADLAPRPEIEVRVGDVILARANGVLDLVGRTAFVKRTPPKLMLSDKLLRLRPRTCRLDARYLHCTFQGSCVRAQLLEAAGGSHMRNVSQSALRAMLLPLPPVGEQRAIADALFACDDRVDAESATLRELAAVKTALSAALLSGELRVAPDEGVA